MNPIEESISLDAPPPSYREIIATSSTAVSRSSRQFDSFGRRQPDSNEPPVFSTSPITLTLLPNSTLITPTSALYSSRSLYQLTHLLNGHAERVGLVEILPFCTLGPDGLLVDLNDDQILYTIHQSTMLPGSRNRTDVTAQSNRLIRGTVLTKELSLTKCWEARTDNNFGKQGRQRRIYIAKLKNSVIEWKDKEGKLVAIEKSPLFQYKEAQTLDIIVPLEKRYLDMLVAVWIARIHQETQKEVAEDIEKEKRRE